MDDEVCAGETQNGFRVLLECVDNSFPEPVGKRTVEKQAIIASQVDKDIAGAPMTSNEMQCCVQMLRVADTG